MKRIFLLAILMTGMLLLSLHSHPALAQTDSRIIPGASGNPQSGCSVAFHTTYGYATMRCVQNPGAAKVYYEFPIPPNAGVNFYFRFHYEAPDETGRCAWIITGCAHPDNTNADCGNMSGNWAVVTTTATRTSGVTYIAQTNNQTLRKPDDTLCGATECRNTIFRAEVIVLSASMTHTTCDIRALEYVFDVTS